MLILLILLLAFYFINYNFKLFMEVVFLTLYWFSRLTFHTLLVTPEIVFLNTKVHKNDWLLSNNNNNNNKFRGL